MRSTKISAQCFFLILSTFAFAYVGLVTNLLPPDRDYEGSLVSNAGPTRPSAAFVAHSDQFSISSGRDKNTIGDLDGKPNLASFIQGWNITGNVNWLLDFAIIGFPKSGTSTLMHYLQNQTQSVFIFRRERCEMGWNQHVPLLVDLDQHYKSHLRMGIKCPRDLEIDLALENYRQYFPKTTFIVGIRHPIQWFESFYNFRVQNEFSMPPPQRLVGSCKKFNQGVCTNRANFSMHLQKIESSRRVFLYEVSQLKDPESELGQIFRTDLERFLDIEIPFHGTIPHVRPGQKPVSTEHQQQLDAKKIRICDDKYKDVRELLKAQASQSATWIQSVFLANPNVVVSSPEYFKQLLQTWHRDPCEVA